MTRYFWLQFVWEDSADVKNKGHWVFGEILRDSRRFVSSCRSADVMCRMGLFYAKQELQLGIFSVFLEKKMKFFQVLDVRD